MPTITGTSSSSQRSSGQRNVIGRFGEPWQNGARGEPAAALAHVGESQDRVGQVVIGRELERVDARAPEARAQARFAGLGRLGEPLAEAAVVRVDRQVTARLGAL